MFSQTCEIQPTELIIQAAALRNLHNFEEAVALIEMHIGSFSGVYRMQAQLQGFYAASEGGLLDKAHALALLLHVQDPWIPSVNAFLKNGKPAMETAGIAVSAGDAAAAGVIAL